MKQLESIQLTPDPHWVGDGFLVRSVFTYNDLGRELSPFLLLDHGPPRFYAPTTKRRGVGAHPHRGFETVTVAFQGEIEHRDSSGAGGTIGPGDVQWMTAGGGIVHEEFHSTRFAQSGGTMEMVQLWVNLPKAHKRTQASYQTLAAADIPRLALADEAGADAGSVRVIAGDFRGTRGIARTFTPIDLWSLELRSGRRVELPAPDGHTFAVLVRRGEIDVDGEHVAREGELAVFSRSGDGVAIRPSGDVELLALGGEPIEEPIVGYGPFVMNTGAEIKEAIDDFESGRMGSLKAR